MRIDKWLWCARIFKTRSLASKTVRAGKVRVNNIKAKPAREVSVSDFVKFQLICEIGLINCEKTFIEHLILEYSSSLNILEVFMKQRTSR